MILNILSPEKVLYDGEADSISVPGKNHSPFVILESHAPVISILEKGFVKYTANGQKIELSISGGFVEVRQNVVSLCVELPK